MSLTKRYKWHKVAENVASIKWYSGNITEVEVEGKPVCIGKFNDDLYGFAANCPHAGAAMLDGYIDGACRVVCAVHSMKFNLKNGREANGDGYRLKMYPVEVREDGVYVGIEESRFKLF